eukprot:GHUV01030466.1.p2 GENE.GHUV01030466.1~~GHUV01030466.1.p2  ORF type:complete len:146 (-),score=39.00 GHUV01030466.1:576-1013(-)
MPEEQSLLLAQGIVRVRLVLTGCCCSFAASAGQAAPGSRVMRSKAGAASAAAAPSSFVALLRHSKAAGDFASFVAHLRTLSPAALDRELKGMVVLEGSWSEDEVRDIGLLLEALHGELDAARNFEMVQALLARVLVVGAGDMELE